MLRDTAISLDAIGHILTKNIMFFPMKIRGLSQFLTD